MRHLPLSLLLFSWLLSCYACQKDTDIQTTEELDEYLMDEMESQRMPALATLIFKSDNILHERYLGQANIAQNIDLTANHPFLLASVSKMVTATALLQLYEQGNFGLDEAINDYLPFSVNVPNSNTAITFRMLLTHTSAIADGSALDDQYYYGEDSPVALSDFMEDYFTPSSSIYDANENFHNFEAGDDHEYSNVGSALIGVLVEEIAGMGFNDYCKQHIFQPLGMNATAWRLDEISSTIVQPYNYVGGDYEAIQHYTFTDYPNGGLRSTARDMHLFMSALANGGTAPNGHQMLSNTTVSEMLTLQIPDLSDDTGLHIFKLNADNNLWGHDGGEQGVATIMAVNPSTEVGAILLTNQGDANLDALLVECYELGLTL